MSRPRGRPRHPDLLTPGEWRVVEGVRHGLTNRAIGARQGISADAVKYHVANVLSKLGMTGRDELRRWTGVRRDSALFKGLPGPRKESTMEPLLRSSLGPLGQVARSVADVAAAQAWYADVLGLPLLYSFGPLAFFDCGGVRLMLTSGEGRVAESILYFRVDDIHAAQQALAARGVQFTHAPHRIHRHADGTEEWMAFFSDNEGRPLALMAQVAPTVA